MDLRNNDIDLRTRDDVETSYSNSNNIDMSAGAASNMFKIMKKMDETEGPRNMRMKYILHTDVERDAGSNRFLEEWTMEVKENEFYTLTARLRMLDVNNLNLENGYQETLIVFDCKVYYNQDIYLCIPDKCTFDGLVAPTTPVQRCVNNYRQSQMVLTTITESTNTQKPELVGQETQRLIVECIQRQIETLVVHGDTICYYEGFKPENIVTYDQMRAKILANDDWVETENAGSFTRTTVVKEWEINSLIDTSKPELVEEEIKILKNVNPDELLKIQDQLNLTDLDMNQGNNDDQVVLDNGTDDQKPSGR